MSECFLLGLRDRALRSLGDVHVSFYNDILHSELSKGR